MKTSELQGAALDWAVAKCEGKLGTFDFYLHESTGAFMLESGDVSFLYSPSTQWKEGGPIIEREITRVENLGDGRWAAYKNSKDETHRLTGPTMLTAGLRCFIASRLGDEVDVPEDLK